VTEKIKTQRMVLKEHYDWARKDRSQFVRSRLTQRYKQDCGATFPLARGTVAAMTGEVCRERSGPNRLLILQPSKMPRQVRDVGGWGSSGPP